nr:hypothetical protein [Gammaproteobacteria bacterium]
KEEMRMDMITLAKIFEVLMLVLFGVSWPINLIKSIKSKTTKGKSLLFLIFIDIGYIFGMISKFVSPTFIWSTDWWVFAIYVINFSFVSADLTMYFINLNREKHSLAV